MDNTSTSHNGAYLRGPLTLIERRYMTDIVLGMIFMILGSGTNPDDLAPFMNLLSLTLYSEWDESSQEMGEKNQIVRNGQRLERYNFSVDACTVLLFLLQIKPPVPNLVASFAHCCGSVEAGAGWILCSVVNSFDDTLRSLGVRCISTYMELTAKSPDSPLSLGVPPEAAEGAAKVGDGSTTSSGKIQSRKLALLAVGKGLASMGPGARSVVLQPSKLTARVTYKLLWHLLKGHRSRIGKKTHAALLHLVVNDVRTAVSSLTSLEFLQEKFIVADEGIGGFRLSSKYITPLLEETNVSPGRSLRDGGLGISTMMRLLRYLPTEIKDKFLNDFLKLAKSSQFNVMILSALPDWQPCLFHMISETSEKLNSGPSNDQLETDLLDLDSQEVGEDGKGGSMGIFESPTEVEKRLDICLELYATLLGNSIRVGGDKVLPFVWHLSWGNKVYCDLTNFRFRSCNCTRP